MTLWLEATIDYCDNSSGIWIRGERNEHLQYSGLHASDLEDLEAELQNIAYQIRDFRMKNFPEPTEIEE